MEIGVSDIPRCINDVPKYLVLKSLNDVSVALLRASPQLYAVGPNRLQYLFVQHQLIVHRQDWETLWPGTFTYSIILRYTYICTSAHYNIHDESESHLCCRPGPRFISSRQWIIFSYVSHKKIQSIHRVKAFLNFVAGHLFVPLWPGTIPYEYGATQNKFGHKVHIHVSCRIRFHDPSVLVTEDSTHRGITLANTDPQNTKHVYI
jgi:hypothetical protein